MNCLCDVINKASYNVKEKFYAKLHEFWDDAQVLIWRLQKDFSRFIGSELFAFSTNAHYLASWMQDEELLDDGNPEYNGICEALKLWTGIEQTLKIGKVYCTEKSYIKRMDEFQDVVDSFWEHGKKSFLNRGRLKGFYETSYLHTLKCYMSKLIKITWERHCCGVGVFTLQGFERRNKESKRIY